ncbi:hypothetical protein U9M48_039657 [Paspalum notatum var. saurae]|uniref:Uncharacterized protein n=1 Tax=Paspalum notatum var. saurae TaxID=547442 RepID=A0AAQ3XBL4_PASNO
MWINEVGRPGKGSADPIGGSGGQTPGRPTWLSRAGLPMVGRPGCGSADLATLAIILKGGLTNTVNVSLRDPLCSAPGSAWDDVGSGPHRVFPFVSPV